MFRNRFKSIKTKISIALFGTVILSILITNITIYIYVTKSYTAQSIGNNKAIMDEISNQINNSLTDVEEYARNVDFDNNIQLYLRTKHDPSEINYYSDILDIEDTIKQYAMLKDNLLDDIYIVEKNGDVLSKNVVYGDTLSQHWYQSFLQSGKDRGYTESHSVSYLMSPSCKEEVVSYITNIYNINNINSPDSYMGRIIFNIKLDALTQPLEELDTEGKSYLLLDSDNRAVYQGSPESVGLVKYAGDVSSGDNVREVGNTYIFSTSIGSTGWKLIRSIDSSDVNKQLIYVSFLFAGLLVLCMLVVSKVIFVLSASITKPLKELNTSIKKFSGGDLDIQVDIHSGDEIEEISNVFNHMVKSITMQMEEIVNQEKEKRKAQYRYLMAQINPHFIYNTLDSIIYLARKGRSSDVINYTKSFIYILRYTIRPKPDEMTVLSEEIKYLENYILLIQYRYRDKIDFEFRCSDDLLNMEIPVMILFPIVENSIFHGILPSGVRGKITVSAERKDSAVIFSVSDDGMGVEKEKLEELRKSFMRKAIAEKYSAEHIGLANVNTRLTLLYGDDSKLQIFSSENEGTRVWFEI